MARAGVYFYAQDGSDAIQVDETYRNYFLRTKVTLTLDQHIYFTGSVNCGEKAFTVHCNRPPIIVVSGTNMVASDLAIVSQNYGGEADYSVSMVGPLNATIEVYVFDTLLNSDASSYGFKVWTAANELIFDVSKKPLRVVGVLAATNNTLPSGIQVPSGKKYGVLCNGGFHTQTVGGSPVTYLYFGYGGAITQSGGNTYATIGIFQTGSTLNSGAQLQSQTAAFVVDLTNY